MFIYPVLYFLNISYFVLIVQRNQVFTVLYSLCCFMMQFFHSMEPLLSMKSVMHERRPGVFWLAPQGGGLVGLGLKPHPFYLFDIRSFSNIHVFFKKKNLSCMLSKKLLACYVNMRLRE